MIKVAEKNKNGSIVRPADSHGITEAVKILKSGGVIVYPTETVYGLGCDATKNEAVERVAELKDRAASFIVLVGSRQEAERWVGPFSRNAEILTNRFWPGPLTLVLRTTKRLAAEDHRGTVGFRISPDPVCLSLCSILGSPILSTSANPRGVEPARNADQAVQYFWNRVDCILDDGPRPAMAVSTVIDLTGEPVRIVREGAVPVGDIEQWIGEVRHA